MARGPGGPAAPLGGGPRVGVDTGGGDRGDDRAADTGRELRLRRPRPGGRALLSLLLGLAVLAGVLGLDLQAGVLRSGGLWAAGELMRSLLRPELSVELLVVTLPQAALLTLAYAVAGMSVALALGLPGALVVSGALTRRGAVRATTGGLGRALFGVLRAPHELVWALLLLQILGPHPLAGILAIGVPYGAIIARVLGERLQDVPAAPLAALRSAGATPAQLVAYGRVPLALGDMVGYVLYRFECAVRAAAVLSFIGLGGIGQQVQIALADLRFARVWTLLAGLLVIIVALDWASSRVRERLAT
jgi:ABC-type phosphate/phosphonate transport system permease subunit